MLFLFARSFVCLLFCRYILCRAKSREDRASYKHLDLGDMVAGVSVTAENLIRVTTHEGAVYIELKV